MGSGRVRTMFSRVECAPGGPKPGGRPFWFCPPVSPGVPRCLLMALFFRSFSGFFRWSKKQFKNGQPKNRCFPKMLAVLASLTSIFGHFGSQNGSPERCCSALFSGRSCASIFRRFLGNKCQNSKNEKVRFNM